MSSNDPAVVVIGMFDGVHSGHRALLDHARDVARAQEPALPVRVITFDPHPRAVLGGSAPGMLTSIDDRVTRLTASGASDVIVVEFTPEFSQMSPAEFVSDVVIGRAHAAHVVVGANFRFGVRASGDVHELTELCAQRNVTVTAVELATDHEEVVSSSRIRSLITVGDVSAADELLGWRYELDGTVVHGAKRGRELGYPTANLAHDPARLVPADGVYGGVAHVDDGTWVAAISVGTNPQFDPGGTAPRTVEAYLLDYDGGEDSLYDLHLTLEFHTRVRGQATFPDLDALIDRMRIDVAEISHSITLTS